MSLTLALQTIPTLPVPAPVQVDITKNIMASLELPKPPDFDHEVLAPLRQFQAEQAVIEAARAAEAERQRVAAEIARTRDRVRPYGTYGNSYSFGNCTAYVASRVAVPNSWGNANSWFWSAQAAGWPTGGAPRVGAIATTRAGWWGHVALVEAIDGDNVLVSEMNYAGFNYISQRWTYAGEFSYIY